MKRFHLIFTAFAIFFIGFCAVGIIKKSVSLPPTPNMFSIGDGTTYTPYLYLALWSWLTWWAWVPLHGEDNDGSQNSTAMSKRPPEEPVTHLELSPSREILGPNNTSPNAESRNEFFSGKEEIGPPPQVDHPLIVKEEIESPSVSNRADLVGIAEDASSDQSIPGDQPLPLFNPFVTNPEGVSNREDADQKSSETTFLEKSTSTDF